MPSLLQTSKEIFMKLAFSSKYGFSLIEILVTLSLMAIAGTALMNMNVTAMKANKSSELRVEFADLKRTITNRISCDNTLGTMRPVACNGSRRLIDKSGKDIVQNGKIGTWDIEATCEVIGNPASNGLSIYATKKNPDGTFKKDPLLNLNLDRSHPKSSLFDPNTRLCSGSFATPASSGCPYGIKSVNFEDQTMICSQPTPAISCSPGQVMTGVVDGQAVCVNQGSKGNLCGWGISTSKAPMLGIPSPPSSGISAVLCLGYDPASGCPAGYIRSVMFIESFGVSMGGTCGKGGSCGSYTANRYYFSCMKS